MLPCKSWNEIGELKSVLFAAAATQLCTVVIVIMCNRLIPA